MIDWTVVIVLVFGLFAMVAVFALFVFPASRLLPPVARPGAVDAGLDGSTRYLKGKALCENISFLDQMNRRGFCIHIQRTACVRHAQKTAQDEQSSNLNKRRGGDEKDL